MRLNIPLRRQRLLMPKGTFEETVISDLKGRGVPFEYEPHSINYKVERLYFPDLLIGNVYIELKGYFRQDAQRKMKAVKAQHPDLDIGFVFPAELQFVIAFQRQEVFAVAMRPHGPHAMPLDDGRAVDSHEYFRVQ